MIEILIRIEFNFKDTLLYFKHVFNSEVSCSEANMSALPEILPPNTLKLNVSHNQVSENDINLFL